MNYMDFYKELADLLNKYRPIKDQLDYRRDDEDWVVLRVPYSFMVGDEDFSYEKYLYVCSNCNSHHFTNEELDTTDCEFCNKTDTIKKIEFTHYNDWLKFPK